MQAPTYESVGAAKQAFDRFANVLSVKITAANSRFSTPNIRPQDITNAYAGMKAAHDCLAEKGAASDIEERYAALRGQYGQSRCGTKDATEFRL